MIILSAGIASVSFLSFLINAPAPELKIIDVNYSRYSENPPCIFVNGTVVNSSPVSASDVTVIICIYLGSTTLGGYAPGGAIGGSGRNGEYFTSSWLLAKTEAVDLGMVSGNSTKNFEASVTYTEYDGHLFAGIQCELLH